MGELLEKATPAEQQGLCRLSVERIGANPGGLILHPYELPQPQGPISHDGGLSSKASPEWWRILDASRTFTMCIQIDQPRTQDITETRLLTKQTRTALELYDQYEQLAQVHQRKTGQELARYLGQPYRSIKRITKLKHLCPQAKDIMRQAAQDPELRERLTPWAIDRLRVNTPAHEQVRQINQLLLRPTRKT